MRPWSLVLAPAVLCLAIAAVRADDIWTIGPRQLPLPGGASAELRAALAAAQQPDPAEHAREIGNLGPADWRRVIAQSDAAQAAQTKALAAALRVTLSTANIAGVDCNVAMPDRVDPANRSRLFVHLHGGGYVFGGGIAGAREAVLIADRVHIPVVSLDYRMPPDHPYPAALEDVVAVWKALLGGRPARSMALGGTSAGGGLALASVMRFRDLGLDLPGAVYAGSPWADLTPTGDSRGIDEGVDPVLIGYGGLLAHAAALYAGGRDLRLPGLSPVYGDFSGFPPTYLVTGTRDLLMSDTIRVHRRLRAAGIAADLNVYEGLFHAGYSALPDTPESAEVYRELADFLAQHLQ